MAIIGLTLRAEPFLHRNRVKRRGETLHVIPVEQISGSNADINDSIGRSEKVEVVEIGVVNLVNLRKLLLRLFLLW